MGQQMSLEDIFKEDVYHLKEIANKRHMTIEKLIQVKARTLSRVALTPGYIHKERKKERKKEEMSFYVPRNVFVCYQHLSVLYVLFIKDYTNVILC